MSKTVKELELDLEHEKKKVAYCNRLIKTMQIERSRIQWFAVRIKCMSQDFKLLLDGILYNRDPDEVEKKLMFVPSEDPNIYEE